MTTPNSVEEAAELAEQLHEKMFPQAPTEVEEEQQEQPEEPTEETEEPDVPHDDDVEELRKFKERYLSLKGKYDAEVPRLHQELREFKQNVFERLDQNRQPQPDSNVPPVVDKFAKFKEEYGEELFEAIKELSSLQAEEKINASLKPVTDQVHNVEETQIKAAQQNFVSYLDTKVQGDWKKLWAGEDPKFIEFLQQPDPSGLYTYADLVQAYNDNWDADKLGKVFNTYFENNQPKVVAPKAPRPEQNAMVAPSRNTGHTAPSANDKRIWTQDAMQEFQKADRMGRYSAEESQAMWDDLLAASQEGRIR
jgi:hypothetical protein